MLFRRKCGASSSSRRSFFRPRRLPAATAATACAAIAFAAAAKAQDARSTPVEKGCFAESGVPETLTLVDANLELLLDDGRRLALAGLEFPTGAMRRAALARLEDWLTGRQIFSKASALDRWSRSLALLYAQKEEGAEAPFESIGATLLGEGLARFRPDAAASLCAELFRAAEQRARAAKAGLWAAPENAPILLGDPAVRAFGGASLSSIGACPPRGGSPQDGGSLQDSAGAKDSAAPGCVSFPRKGMVIVEGKLSSAREWRGRIYLNFGAARTDFAAMISTRNLAMFEQAGMAPRALSGRHVRVRGLIETHFGPRMELSSPSQLELLPTPGP